MLKFTIPEKQIQNACIQYLEILENQGKLYFFRSQSGSVNTIRANGSQGFFKTGKVGVPDITVCIGGQFIGLEIKTIKGKQSPAQIEAQQNIEKAGGQYHIIRSANELISIFKNIIIYV